MRVLKRAMMAACLVMNAGWADAGNAADVNTADRSLQDDPASIAGVSWTGFYAGVHTGTAWGETQFSQVPGEHSIYGDEVQTPGPLGGGQIGYNYQLGPWVFGVEADASGANLDGTNTCLAFSGDNPSDNCRSHIQALGSLTGRVGYAFGEGGRTLLYAKGGAAWAEETSTLTTNHVILTHPIHLTSSDTQETRWGWTAGGGIEYALSPGWSAKLEYEYYDLGSGSVSVPAISADTPSSIAASQSLQVVKVGLNYRFGASGEPSRSLGNFAAGRNGWEFEAGSRYWSSIGKFQKDLHGPSLVSRLTYDSIEGNAGEFFGRVEAPLGVFVKGYAGGSGLGDGHMNDEDWGLPLPGPRRSSIDYSNTLSPKVDGSMRYGSIDVGYDLFRAPEYKLGAFVGYNRFQEKISAHGCIQIANMNSDCAIPRPTTGTGITEDDTWDSLRLGIAGEFMLTNRLKLSFDAAWLPYTHFDGVDHHWNFTPTKLFSQSGEGDGTQIDAILSYKITDRLSLGVGGRYWSFKTADASYSCKNCGGAGTVTATFPAKANAEEYGLLLQGSYTFGDDEQLEPLK